MTHQILPILLLVGGGLLLLAVTQPHRTDPRARLRRLDGGAAPTTLRQWRQAVVGAATLTAIVAAPLLLVLAGASPVVAALVALVLLPTIGTVVFEFSAAFHHGIPRRFPVTAGWQRRVVGGLVARTLGPLPGPPINRRPAGRRRTPPRAAGQPNRLLIVPRDAAPIPLADIAEAYLGSRSLVADLVRMNATRHSPQGELIDENSQVSSGWTLILPSGATGEHLVDLPPPHRRLALTSSGPDGIPDAPGPSSGDETTRTADSPDLRETTEAGPTTSDGPEAAETAPHDRAFDAAGDATGTVSFVTSDVVVLDPAPSAATPPNGGAGALDQQETGRGSATSSAPRAGAELFAGDVTMLDIAPDGTVRSLGSSPPAPESASRSESEEESERSVPPDVPSPDFPSADLPWELVAAPFLADGILTAVTVRRLQRQYERPVGADTLPLDAAAASVLMAAHLGADEAGAVDLQRALRPLGSQGEVRVLAARVHEDSVHVFVVIPPGPDDPDRRGRREAWRMDRGSPTQPADEVMGSASLPGLVTLGEDESGRLLVNLGAAGGPIGVTGEPDAVRGMVLAMALELLVARWSDRVRVVMCGFGLDLGGFDPRLVCAADLAQGVADLQRFARDRWASAAPHPPLPIPQFLLLARSPTDAELDLVYRELPVDVFGRVGVVVAGGTDRDAWTFVLDRGVIRSPMDASIEVVAQRVSDGTAQAFARLARAEERSLLADLGSTEPVLPPLSPAVDIDDVERMVRLFGRVGVFGPDAEIEADGKAVELLSFLALHGPATRGDIARIVFPLGIPATELEGHLARARRVAGRRSDGSWRLLQQEDRLAVSGVVTDWQLFVALYRAGRASAAVDLLATAEYSAPVDMLGHYAWLAVMPLGRVMPGFVADVIHLVAQGHLDGGRPDRAVWTAGVGLRAEPTNQVVRDDLARALRTVRDEHLVAATA